MSSPAKSNDDTNTTTASVAICTEAAAITTSKTNSTTITSGDHPNPSINANGMAKINEIKIEAADGDKTQNSNGSTTDGIGINKYTESTAASSPESTGTTSANSGQSITQTPPSAPRSKPLEKPKPLKLPEQHHGLHVGPQLLYHPAGGAFAGLGASPMLGSIPHPIYVGNTHLAHQSVGAAAMAHHVQSSLQQNHQQNPNHAGPGGDGTTAVSTDEILETMEQINRSVKAGQFSTALAGYIFRLYGYLKHIGELLEQSHKSEMNRVFVSLRQACCRDSGQLGTPCRLKIMELIELRAMGWRPNLAHSQYYLNRGGGSLTNGFGAGPNMGSEFNPLSSTDAMSGGDMEQLGAAPVSAPPFGTFPMNPFAFNLPPTSLGGGATPVASAADLVSSAAAAAMSPPQASYYLIPATQIGHTQAGIAFISPTAAATVMPPMSPMATLANVMAQHHHQQQQRLHMPVSSSLSQPMLNAVGINPSTSPTLQGSIGASSGLFPRGAVTKTSGKYSKPAKIPGKSQYRDELIIRNADSGKSKRRYHKVPQGAKERTLTITGPTEESIDQAKVLIEETIRRNVSPIRGEGEDDLAEAYRGATLICSSMEGEEDQTNGDGHDDDFSDEEDGKERAAGDEGVTIEAGQLGEMLKLQCNDPALLEAAKQALAAYFRGQKPSGHQALRRTTTDAAARDQSRKERRKSMPTLDAQRLLAAKQSSPPKMQGSQPQGEPHDVNADAGELQEGIEEEGKSPTIKPLTLTMMISPPIAKQKASAARSTPNLAAGYNKRALCMMKSMDPNAIARGSGLGGDDSVETKFVADESGGGTLVINENKSRVTVRVVYTREFVLQCSASPFANLTPSSLPWVSQEAPEILRPLPGKFDIGEYKKSCLELKQLHQ